MSSVEPPKQFLILNDKVLTTANVESVSSVSNLKLELGVANENNNGNLSLFCIDNDPTVRQDYDFRIQNSGSLYKADYIWKNQDDDVWYGEQDRRYLSSPNNGGVTGIPYNATGVYHTKNNRTLLFYGKGNNTIGISYQPLEFANNYGSWTTTEFDFTTTDAGFGADGLTGQNGVLDVAELPNQKLIMVVKYERDLYLYISDDGFDWELYSPSILSRFTGITGDINNVKLAVSGNYIRILGIIIPSAPSSVLGDESYKIFSIVSADRGSTWVDDSFRATAYQKEASGADRFSFDICNYDDNGTFIISILGDERSTTSTQTDVTGIEETFIEQEEDDEIEIVDSYQNTTEVVREVTYTSVNKNRYSTFIASSINPPSKIKRLGISPGLLPQNIYLCNHADHIVAITVSMTTRNDLVQDISEPYTNSMTGEEGLIFTIKNYEYQMYWLPKNKNPLNTSFRTLNGGYSITGFFGVARFIPAKGKLFSSSDSMHWFHAIRDREQPLHYAYRNGGAYTNIGNWLTRPLKDQNIDNFAGSQDLSDYKTNKHQPTGRMFIPQWNCLVGSPGVGANGSIDTVWNTEHSGAMFGVWRTDNFDIRGVSNTTSSDKLFYTFIDPTFKSLSNAFVTSSASGISDFGTGTYTQNISPERNWCFIPETSTQYEDPYNNNPHGSCIIWEAMFNEGTNSNGTGLNNDNMVVGISSYAQINGVLQRLNCTVRHAETGLVVYDNIAGAPLATLLPDSGTYGSTPFRTSYWEFRWAWYPYQNSTQFILSCRKNGTEDWLSTSMISPTIENSTIADIKFYNQMIYFGSMIGANGQSSKWKKVEVHPNNDLGTFALEQVNLNPIANVNALDAIRGKSISDSPTIFDIKEGSKAVWGGASAHYNDRFSATMTFDYPPSNIYSHQSPRVQYRTAEVNSISSTLHSTIILKSKDDELFYHDAISVINTNVDEIEVSYSMDGSSFGSVNTLATNRVKFGRINSINDNIFEINFDDTNNVFNGEINSNSSKNYYLRITNSNGVDYLCYKIDRSYGNNIFVMNPNVMNASTTAAFSSSLVGSTVAIYNDRAYKKYSSSLFGKYIKIELKNINFTAEKYGYIGSIVAGKKFDFDVPLKWEYSDTEQANQQRFKTRSGISWSYNQGPSERTLSLTMIGDVTQRSRRELRERLKTTNGYGESNLVFITETTGLDREMIFHGYPSDQTDFSNAGWYYDENASRWFSVGDLSLTFIEIT